jgi:NADH-quinone oxidoreductase chain G
VITIIIDGIKILVDRATNVFQVCDFLKKEIPRFCYHKGLMVAGNCRMCLVEIERMPKPVASCAMPVQDNMIVYTNTPLVRKARESVLEFLLINHPLDCPICDQGGECDLQDQNFIYGSDKSRFYYKPKRAVEDKNMGALIKTVMTRCIHCTRCVRFAEEIAGCDILGTTGRGNQTEIGFYIKNKFNSELSGNVIDLCPVGALTSKPYAFTARPWELTSYASIDLNDAVGANIKVDVCNNQVVRISPRECWEINDVWISDKARFNFDGLKYQRIHSFYFKAKKRTCSESLNFLHFLITILNKKKYKSKNFRIICGEKLSVEAISRVQQFSYELGYGNIQSTATLIKNSDFEKNYKFTAPFIDLEKNDFVLLINTNLRYDAPNLNIKLKKNISQQKPIINYIGTFFANTFKMNHVGLTLNTLKQIAEGKHKVVRQLTYAKNPNILVAGKNKKELSLLNNILTFINFKFGANITNTIFCDSAAVGSNDLGLTTYKPRIGKHIIYTINIDNQNLVLEKELSMNILNICQNYHGNTFSEFSDILLPNASPFEQEGSYLNLCGKKQKSYSVIKHKSSFITEQSYINEVALNCVKYHLLPTHKLFKHIHSGLFLLPNNLHYFDLNFYYFNLHNKYNVSKIVDFTIKNFFQTNTISQLSPTMQKTLKQMNNLKNLI